MTRVIAATFTQIKSSPQKSKVMQGAKALVNKITGVPKMLSPELFALNKQTLSCGRSKSYTSDYCGGSLDPCGAIP